MYGGNFELIRADRFSGRFIVGFWIVVAMSIGLSPALAASPAKFGARDIYYKDEATKQPKRMAARIVLQLVEGKQKRQVSLDHVFKTGDAFQFMITPNRDAYLYLVNINPVGIASYIWPSEDLHKSLNNRVAGGAETLVPESGTFEFGGTAGDEWLLLILSPVKQLPNLDRLKLELPTYEKAPGRVVEYSEIHTKVRKFGARGTPGLTDDPTSTDPATYGAQKSTGERVLVYPYLMRHQPEE